ncbi:MAG: hypothetical protein EHV01_004560 [Spiroplasma sp. hy2]|uniref:hypothetical protein n=1 Tax=Spiroplasma sp. hy2 TaxID=2490850 RepID=UPI003848ED13
MKKLLSLLSVLTISGTAVPTTIAASPYQKEETINNSKKLNRSKREINQDLVVLKDKKIEKNTLTFYFNNKDEKVINYFPSTGFFLSDLKPKEHIYKKIYNFNLGKINPIIYNKIYFITDTDFASSIEWGTGSKSVTSWIGKTINGILNNKEIIDIMWNEKADEYNYFPDGNIDRIANLELQSISERDGFAGLDANQKFGLTYYLENEEWHLQILILQKAYITTSSSGGQLYLNIGSGIKLIQDDNNYVDLLDDWNENFKDFIKNTENKFKNELNKYGNDERGQALKKVEINNILDNFRDKIINLKHIVYTIIDHKHIKKLYSKVANLEYGLNKLKNDVEKLSSLSPLSLCGSVTNAASIASGFIPVVGKVASSIFSIVSAGCSLANEFN